MKKIIVIAFALAVVGRPLSPGFSFSRSIGKERRILMSKFLKKAFEDMKQGAVQRDHSYIRVRCDANCILRQARTSIRAPH